MNSLAEKKKKTYTVTFADSEAAARFASDKTLPVKDFFENRVNLLVNGAPAQILQKIAAANPIDIDIKTQSLEELFLHFYDEEEGL